MWYIYCFRRVSFLREVVMGLFWHVWLRLSLLPLLVKLVQKRANTLTKRHMFIFKILMRSKSCMMHGKVAVTFVRTVCMKLLQNF